MVDPDLAARRCAWSAEPIRLPTDRAVSLGVIVNELVTNACKYAYPGGRGGRDPRRPRRATTAISCWRSRTTASAWRRDAAPTGTGIGTKLIGAMAASLGATLDYDAAHAGVRAVLRAAV